MAFIAILGQTLAAFVATNLDDIILLMLFFGRRQQFRPGQIVLGQFLGFSVLVATSWLGALGLLLLPEAWIVWLGLVPLSLGLWHLWRGAEDEDPDVDALSTPRPGWAAWLAPQTFAVAAVRVSNGADNLAIYIPFLANQIHWLPVILLGWYLCLALLCLLASRLVSVGMVAELVERYGRWLLPVVLILLGLVILWEGGAIDWIAAAWASVVQ